MDTFTAIGIAEGFIETDDENKLNEAWQHLIDTGICWQLQGWFGRTASYLIEQGLCRPPQSSDVKEPDTRTEDEKLKDEEAMWRTWGDY